METVGDFGPLLFASGIKTMPANKRVRVIKRDERKNVDEAEQSLEREEKAPREITRAIKSTVTGWVSEHRQKREKESSRNFDQLFAEAA